jgi:transposase
MTNSAKSPTESSKVDRSAQKRTAILHFRDGGTPSAFAKDHGIPRTTVIGWRKKWDEDRESTVMGRPRKLPRYNESAVLTLMTSNSGFQDWRSVRDCIRTQPGDKPNRRTVFRLMKRWGVSSREKKTGPGMFLSFDQWIQPTDTVDHTVDRSGRGNRATIWRLISRRGIEGFMFTKDASKSSLEAVAGSLAKRLKCKHRILRTNHAGLAKQLGKISPDLKIEVVSDS